MSAWSGLFDQLKGLEPGELAAVFYAALVLHMDDETVPGRRDDPHVPQGQAILSRFPEWERLFRQLKADHMVRSNCQAVLNLLSEPLWQRYVAWTRQSHRNEVYLG